METNTSIIPLEKIEEKILIIRNKRVLLDSDLAKIYGVTTKQLNQQLRRNLNRFPEDFVFQLTKEEKDNVVTFCDHLKNLKYSKSLPYAFTEHGAIMAANILNSSRAIAAGIFVVRAFVKLREIYVRDKAIAVKLEQLEKKYDSQFKIVFDAIRQLMTEPVSKKRQIGFKVGDKAK